MDRLRLTRIVVPVLMATFLSGIAHAQINVSITSSTAPSGTATAPLYVIDSDADNLGAGYVRDTIACGGTVQLTNSSATTAASGTYRLVASMKDMDGNIVGTAESASQSVTNLAAGASTTRTFSLNIDPTTDLGAGLQYEVIYKVQAYLLAGYFGGMPLYWWQDTAGAAVTTPAFTVCHFTDTPENTNHRNARGWLRGAATWTKTHAVSSGSGTGKQFTVTFPYSLARYDLGGSSVSIPVRFTAIVTDDLGNSVALESSGIASTNFTRSATLSGTPLTPHIVSSTYTLSFSPSAQLDSANRTYKIAVKFEHLETPSTSTYRDNGTSPATSLQRLLHFNGRLLFGDVTTAFESISNTPAAGSIGVNFINTTLNIPSASINDFPDYSVAAGADLNVRLESDGDAVVSSGWRDVAVAGGGDVSATYGGIVVSYPGTILDSIGAYAGSTVVHLPQGLSYTPNAGTAAGRYQSEVTLSGRALTNQFKHSGTLSLATPVTAGIFDEARPVLYSVSNFTLSQSGLISFTATAASWVHKAALDDLAANQTAGLHATPDMQYRLSNDGYLLQAHLTSSRSVDFVASADGTARMRNGEIDVAAGSFFTHFPKESEINWTGTGLIMIQDGKIDSASHLDGAMSVKVNYDGSCEGDACGPPPGSAVAGITLIPTSGQFQFTSDGGIHANASMSPTDLRWGIRGDGTTAHRTDDFSSAAFLAPGNQLYQSDNPFAAPAGPFSANAPILAPGSLLLAGYQPSTHTSPVYPGTSGYKDGIGSYPGATMSVPGGGMPGASRLADMTTDYAYALQEEVSKYYVRPSGVSGRHVAVEDSFDGAITMYDYAFRITRFQLTYLSNENEKSWINGSVEVPYPSGFKQAFQELKLTCTGALDQAEIDPADAGSKPLAYWNGAFTPLAMSFKPKAGAGCYDDRSLTLGLITGAANIDTPLAGTLAFMSTGNIGTITDAVEGADGRLGLPGTLPMDGPGEETYQLTPVCKLYFNNPSAVGAPATGFVGFASRCNVPFFEDLKVHVTTSAQAGVPAAVYMTAGWTEGGQTHFTQTDFDAAHRGFPNGVNVDTYRNPSTQNAYVPVATQSLFGIVPLSYPLKWSPSGRYFTSWSAVANDLLVLNVEHQVDYLSADNAELSFGAQYDGLPEINLASTAVDAVDAQLGAAKALTDAATQYVTDTLNQGVDELGDLASDTLEAVLDEVIGAMETEIIDPLYHAVDQSYQNAVAANTSYGSWVNASTGSLKSEFDRYLDGSIGPASQSIKGRLDQLHNISGDAVDLISEVQGGIDQAILAIDSVTSRIEVVSGDVKFNLTPPEVPSVPSAQLVNGILAEVLNESTGQLEREIVQNLVGALISELAPPDLAPLLTSLAGELTAEANAELNALLADFDPTLDRVTEALLEARAYLVTVRNELAVGQEIFVSFQQIVTQASAEIDAIVDGLRATAYGLIDDMAVAATYGPTTVLGTAGDLMGEFSKEEFVALIRNELRDQLLAASFIQQIQYTLRQHISELEMAMNSAIDSAFGEVNRMCKELIKESLGPIDDAINELVGDVNDYVGAGSIDGYAHIQGDTLRRLRIDAKVQFKIPEEMELQAYFEMLCYDSETDVGSAGCLAAGEQQVEVKIGALDVPLDWVSPDLRANLEVKFSMETAPSVYPKGIGGALEMTGGELDFQSLKITDFAAAVAVGIDECYLAATARVIVSNYEAAGGIFFGRTCSIEPLELVDPDVAALLGPAPFTGAYVYGEVWIPISEVILGIPASCLFRISAGVGAGAFYFIEGPTFGGKMLLGVSGEALCAVSIGGQVSMIGVMSGGSLRFAGKGTLTGKAGWCPLCVKFKESADITYQDGDWSVDF